MVRVLAGHPAMARAALQSGEAVVLDSGSAGGVMGGEMATGKTNTSEASRRWTGVKEQGEEGGKWSRSSLERAVSQVAGGKEAGAGLCAAV